MVIALDDEGELAREVGRGDGSVRTDDRLAVRVEEGRRGVGGGLDDDA